METYWQNIKTGSIYKVAGVAKHSESLEELVVYENDIGQLWVRPKELFYQKFKVVADFTDKDWDSL